MGISGDCVVPYMADRFKKTLSSSSKQYDWILILGGTILHVQSLSVKHMGIHAAVFYTPKDYYNISF